MRPYFFTLLALLPLRAEDPQLSGEQLFSMNCAACHLTDQEVVGPSLVEMRRLYHRNMPGFIHWAKNPQQKRKGAVEMPSMAHLPDAQLARIFRHVMAVTEGVREKKGAEGDLYGSSKTITARPNVIRIFMEDASPAAVAVAVDETYSFCWDPAHCRLRYVWRDGFIAPSNFWAGKGFGYVKRDGTHLIRETESPLSQLMKDGEMSYLGYRLENRVPTFRYEIGSTSVTERLEVSGGKLTRRFTLKPPLDVALHVPLADEGGVSWTSADGEIAAGTLTLTPESTAAFTLILEEK
ncbi:MAG: c-type cytochrome [Verrucomicrobiales bacterium]